MKKIIPLIVLLILLFLVIVPRGVELVNHNYLFLFDQGREYLAAKGISVDHKFILIGTELGAGSAGISGIFHGPIYYYFLTIPFLLFNGDPYGGMVLMFLFSVSAVFAGFFLGKKIWGFWWGIVVAFLFAISPPLISQARFIWSPNPPTIFIVLAFFFVYQYLTTRKNWAVFWTIFFSGFVYNFEFALAVPMVVGFLLFSLFIKQKSIKFYISLFLGLAVAFLPMIFFEIRHNFQAIHGIISYIFSHNASSKIHESFLSVINGHCDAFYRNLTDTFPQNGFSSGIAFAVVLMTLSFWNLIKEKNNNIKQFITYLLLLIPVNVLVFGFLRNTVYHYYLTDLNIVYILLFTYSFYCAWKSKIKLIFILFIIYAAILLFAGIENAIYTWHHDINDYGGTAKIKGIEQAMDYIYKDGKGKKFGVLVFAPPVYTYQYDYMIWWYGERKYHYVPYQEKKGTVYLLIEPDPAKPWSYKGWLETVIKTGDILETKKLSPSGFVIQKRQF